MIVTPTGTATWWRIPAAEKAELWPLVIAAYQGYDGYQRRTQRDIPLVICEPR